MSTASRLAFWRQSKIEDGPAAGASSGPAGDTNGVLTAPASAAQRSEEMLSGALDTLDVSNESPNGSSNGSANGSSAHVVYARSVEAARDTEAKREDEDEDERRDDADAIEDAEFEDADEDDEDDEDEDDDEDESDDDEESELAAASLLPSVTEAAYGEWLFPGAEDLFRSVYTRACPASRDTIAVCSALAGEGKTTVALGLAVAIASDHIDRRVVLVEADVQRPVLAADFRFEPLPGVAECLSLGVPLEAACRSTFIENLSILPAGEAVANAGRLLHSKRIIALTEQLRELFDVVILDVPAVLTTSTATSLANRADGILFVVRAGITPAPLVKQALGHFEANRIRGVVVNEARSHIPRWVRRILGL